MDNYKEKLIEDASFYLENEMYDKCYNTILKMVDDMVSAVTHRGVVKSSDIFIFVMISSIARSLKLALSDMRDYDNEKDFESVEELEELKESLYYNLDDCINAYAEFIEIGD